MAARNVIFPTFVENLLDLFYPPRCLVCEQAGAIVHAACQAKMPYLTEPLCHSCGVPLTFDRQHTHLLRCHSNICLMLENERALDRVASTFAHTEGARQAALRLKYKGVSNLSRWLGRQMVATTTQHNFPKLDYILPVPLHRKRLRERGYNQSGLLARDVARELGLVCLQNRLIRQRYTSSQVGLGVGQRARNVADAFQWQGINLQGESLLLIDDVCTTGATLNACAKTLKAAGAGRVVALTLTREYV